MEPELELEPEDKEEQENGVASQIERPVSSITETAAPYAQVEKADPSPVEAVEVEQVNATTDSQRERHQSADQDSREFIVPHKDTKEWKAPVDKFLEGFNITDTNNGLLIASGVFVFLSFWLMILCYTLSCFAAGYILEDVKELGTESRFPDKVYRVARIQLWGGAGMLAMLIAFAIDS